MNKYFLRSTAALTLVAFGVMASFDASPAASDPIAADRRLVITAADTEMGRAAPFLQAGGGQSYALTQFVFDNLVGQDSEGNPAPQLAKSWNVAEDGLSVDLTLNLDAHWHDGMPFSAKDVAFTFEYAKSHPMLFVSVQNIMEVEVLSPHRIRLSLKHKDAGFVPQVLGGTPILPAHIYEGQDNPRQFTDAQALIGTGPYRLTAHDRTKGRYQFQAVEGYYGAETRYNEVLIVKMQPDVAIKAVAEGKVDLVISLPYRLVSDAQKNGLAVETSPGGFVVKLRFEHQGLFADMRRRQAIAHIIDRQDLVDIGYRGGARVASLGYLQDNSPWFNSARTQNYAVDFEMANDLLTESGWTKTVAGDWLTQQGEPITLRLVASANESGAAQVLRDQLERFGFDVSLRIEERSMMGGVVKAEAYDLMLITGSTLGDPSTAVGRIFGTRWNNENYPRDGKLFELSQTQSQTLDPQKRAEILSEFQNRYSIELPAIALVNKPRFAAHNARAHPRFFREGLAVGIPMAMHKYMLLEP